MSDFKVGDKVVVVVDQPEDEGRYIGQTATVTGVNPEYRYVRVEFIPEDGPQTDHMIYDFDYDEIEKACP